MHDVEFFTAEQIHQLGNAPRMPENVEASVDWDRFNPKAFPANLVGIFTVRAYANDLVTRLFHAAHQWQQEMIERKIEITKLANFHDDDQLFCTLMDAFIERYCNLTFIV